MRTALEPWLRSVVRSLLRVGLRLYYRSLQVQGLERFPDSGAALLVANHPGSLLDPAILVHVLSRRVRFGAKHTLFRGPLRFVLEAFGAIPLVRAQDDPRAMRRNLEAFDRYAALLRQRQVAAIFPEGLTQDDPRVAPIKTGAARIALQAEAAEDFELGLAVVPVGLQFEPRRRFRADVLVRVGEPLRLDDLEALHAEAPRRAVRELTARIEAALKQVAFHVESTEHVAVVRRLADVYLQRARSTGIAGVRGKGLRAELLQKIAAAVNHFEQADPASVGEVRRLLERYERLRAAAGVDERLLEQPPRLLPWPLGLLQVALEIGLGLPLALFGFVTGVIPYLIVQRWARASSRRADNPASQSLSHILLGALLFPAAYGLQVLAVWRLVGGLEAVVLGALLAPAGLFALAWGARMRQLAVHVGGGAASWLKVDAVARVQRAQDELLHRMESMRDRYRTEVLGWKPLSQRFGRRLARLRRKSRAPR